MHINRRKLTVIAMSAVVVAAMVGPQAGTAGAKKKYKVSWTVKGDEPGQIENIDGSISSKSLGKGRQTGSVKLPKSFWTWKFKGGTLVASGVGGLKGSIASGTWKLTKGKSKGKFKGATGKGTFKGDIATGVIKFKGTITY